MCLNNNSSPVLDGLTDKSVRHVTERFGFDSQSGQINNSASWDLFEFTIFLCLEFKKALSKKMTDCTTKQTLTKTPKE